jgi:antirestriction protein ArdC
MAQDIYQSITDKIVAQIEAGAASYRMPLALAAWRERAHTAAQRHGARLSRR